MSKAYLVTSGNYDDYFVRAVFLDKAKAMEYCAEKNGRKYSKDAYFDEMRIEECDLLDNEVDVSGKAGFVLTYRYSKRGSIYDLMIGLESDVDAADAYETNYSHHFINADSYGEALKIARSMVEEFDNQAGALE